VRFADRQSRDLCRWSQSCLCLEGDDEGKHTADTEARDRSDRAGDHGNRASDEIEKHITRSSLVPGGEVESPRCHHRRIL